MVAFSGGHVGVGLLSLLLSLPSVLCGLTVDQGRAIRLNGTNYYAGGIPASRLKVHQKNGLAMAAKEDEDVVPMTVIRTREKVFTSRVLEEVVAEYMGVDDVFQAEFLRGAFVPLL